MRFLVWSIAVVLFLALVNAVASWFGFDVTSAGEEDDAGHAAAHSGHGTQVAPAAGPHAPANSSHASHH